MFVKSVDTILKSFQKNISDLEACGRRNTDYANDCVERIETLTEQRDAYTKESTRAAKVAHNLKTLIGEEYV